MQGSLDNFRPLLLNIGLAVHDADWNWKNVKSPFIRIYYVTEGEAKIVFPSRVQVLIPGHLYIIPAFTLHSYECDSRFEHYYLHIVEDYQSGSSVLESWTFPTEIQADSTDRDLIKRLCEMNPAMRLPESDPTSYDNEFILMQNIIRNKQRNFSDRVESRGILYLLLSRFLRFGEIKEEADDNRIQQVLIYIRQHIYEKLNVEVLVDLSCLSEDHFIRLFKRATGNTPLQYINMKKMELAQLLLITNNIPIKDIAYQLSYDDYSYFIRLFKKIVGLTPKKYREQKQNYFR